MLTNHDYWNAIDAAYRLGAEGYPLEPGRLEVFVPDITDDDWDMVLESWNQGREDSGFERLE